MNRENSLKTNVIIYTALAVAAVLATIWAVYEKNEKNRVQTELENRYSKSFYEMADYVNDIETELRKGMLVKSPAQLATISGNIYRMSNSAKSCLGELPINEVQLDNTAKFLSQVGDYTYVLSQSSINGEAITDKQYKEIESLTDYAQSLNTAMDKIKEGVSDGTVSFTDKRKKSRVMAAGDIFTDLQNVEKSFEEYPSLIYDGPFSEHIENRQSQLINSSEEISMETARKAAADFIKTDIEKVVFECDTQNSAIDAYNFYADIDPRVNISISKRGGFVIYFLKNRDISEEKLGFGDAVRLGSEYLALIGFTSMKSSYYDKAAGVATVNYAYVQDGAICYSDLIKVKVALDNGEILGMEANGYLMNHQKRKNVTPHLTVDEARKCVSSHLNINSSSVALIPKDSLREVLCYEFKGSFKGKNYIIYINASNGREEKILMLIESENGILTV